MKKSEVKPIFTERGTNLPRRDIYKKLRMLWLNQDGNTNIVLSKMIGVSPQVASTYASGTDNRTPPWSAILTLCHELGYEIVVRPNEVLVQEISTV
jgi:hypothetical protein